MLELDPNTQAKLIAFAALPGKQVAEVVAVHWPAPTGTKYYAVTQLDQITPSIPVSPIEARLIPEDVESHALFQTITSDSALSDEEVELNFWDADGAIADLAYLHGAGVKVEVSYWFPQVELLLPNWWGHLGLPEDADSETFTCTAAVGFRSPLLPMPRRALFDTCQAIFGGLLTSLEEILDNDCPHNLAAGGTVGVPGSELLPPCSRKSRTVCTQYLGDAKSYLGFETPVQTILVGQTQGPAITFSSRGNASNLKNPLRVIFGKRIVRNLDLLDYTPTTNTNHPELGFVRVLFAICEGRVRSVSGVRVNGALIAAMHLNTRRGERRQSPTGYSSSTSNYSGTAHFYANYGQVNAAQYGPGNLNGEAIVEGLDEIRVYTSPTAYTKTYTTNRAWCLMEMHRNRRWGYGVDDSRLVVQDWIELAAWCAKVIRYTDPDGNVYTFKRSTFNADLQERTTQQQITDVCLSGRFSLPFQYQGKIRIVPLKKESLEDVKLFTDVVGNERNICVDENGKSTLRRSQILDDELPNKIVLNFEDSEKGNVERPLSFEDQPLQLSAGRTFGDSSIRVVPKPYSAMGVTTIGEAVRLGNLLLDLGEFDTGGLKNNLRITFTTFFTETLGLHPYKLIRVLSRQLDRYGFEYFRIMSMERQPDIKVTITAQAYPVDYYANLEEELEENNEFETVYEAEALINTLSGGAVRADDTSCSGGKKVVGIGLGGSLRFNNVVTIYGATDTTIYYKSTQYREAYVSVNGGAASLVEFPPTGGAVSSIQILRTLTPNANNTITFFNPGGAAPDLDRIVLSRHTFEPPGGGVCTPEFGEVIFENGHINIPVLPC